MKKNKKKYHNSTLNFFFSLSLSFRDPISLNFFLFYLKFSLVPSFFYFFIYLFIKYINTTGVCKAFGSGGGLEILKKKNKKKEKIQVSSSSSFPRKNNKNFFFFFFFSTKRSTARGQWRPLPVHPEPLSISL